MIRTYNKTRRNLTRPYFYLPMKETKMTNKRTNITVKDSELWAWAFGRAKQLNYKSVSDYLFDLIKKDKEKQQKS